VATEDIELTWTSAGASCSVNASGSGGSYIVQDFPDEGHHTIPAGTLAPSSNQTFQLTCGRITIDERTGSLSVAHVHTTTSPIE
jgi:hypothetical protein